MKQASLSPIYTQLKLITEINPVRCSFLFLFPCVTRKQVLEWASTRLLWSASSHILQVPDKKLGGGKWIWIEEVEEGVDKAHKWLAKQPEHIPREKHRKCCEYFSVALRQVLTKRWHRVSGWSYHYAIAYSVNYLTILFLITRVLYFD